MGRRPIRFEIESKILNIADSVEVMCTHRPYSPALGRKTTIKELKTNIGTYEEGKYTFKLKYSGSDIMKALGIEPSPLVGEIKKLLEEKVCTGELKNSWSTINDYIGESNKLSSIVDHYNIRRNKKLGKMLFEP